MKHKNYLLTMQPSMLDESEHGKKKEEDEIVEESPKIENS